MYKAYVREQEYLSGIRDCLEKGQIPPKAKSFIEFDVELILDDVKYNYQVARRGPKNGALVCRQSERGGVRLAGTAVLESDRATLDSPLASPPKSSLGSPVDWPCAVDLEGQGNGCTIFSHFCFSRFFGLFNLILARFCF